MTEMTLLSFLVYHSEFFLNVNVMCCESVKGLQIGGKRH
jgi:hypothetical protein